MAWKKEYAESRKIKAQSDPLYRAKRNEQSVKDKEARKKYMKEYYAKNPEKFAKRTPEKQAEYNERRRQIYAENENVRLIARKKAKDWQDANPEKRKSQRLRKFDIQLSDYKDMLAMQNGSCAICGYSDMSNPNFFPVVDHCHSTGVVRGLLCMECNMGLGKFKDDINRLWIAISYLQRNGSSGAS